MGAKKRVIREIPLDSDSEVEQVEEPVTEPVEAPVVEPEPKKQRAKKIKVVEPEPEPVPEPVEVPEPKEERPKKKVISAKRAESLRKANEARLRQKIEKQIADEKAQKESQERMLEEKILKLLSRHVQRPAPQPVAPTNKNVSKRNVVPESDSEESDDSDDYDKYKKAHSVPVAKSKTEALYGMIFK